MWSLLIYRKPLIPEKALLSHNIAQAKGQFLHTLSENYSKNYEEFCKSTNDAGSFLDDFNAQMGVCDLCLFGLVLMQSILWSVSSMKSSLKAGLGII